MGNAQLAMNNVSEAEEEYRKALDRESDHAPAKVGIAKIAIERENYEEANDLLTSVTDENSTEIGAEAQFYLGELHRQQGNHEQAVKAYSNVSVLYETYDEWVAKAFLNRAKSYIQMGQRGEARSSLNTLIEDYPNTPQAKEAQELLDSQ